MEVPGVEPGSALCLLRPFKASKPFPPPTLASLEAMTALLVSKFTVDTTLAFRHDLRATPATLVAIPVRHRATAALVAVSVGRNRMVLVTLPAPLASLYRRLA